MRTNQFSKKRFILVFSSWLLGIALFLIGFFISIYDYNQSKFTYDDFDYAEYIYAGFAKKTDAEMGNTVVIYTEEGITLTINNLLTNRKLEKQMETLSPGEKLYCYTYEKDNSVYIAEIKAKEFLLSLQEYSNAYRNNGIVGLVIFPVFSIICAFGAHRTCLVHKKENDEQTAA